jgi:succinate dehydrogenase hydrophobic anchor subunit
MPTLTENIGILFLEVSGFNPKTVFGVTFFIMLFSLMLHLLIMFWTGGITYTLIWSKIMRRKLIFHKFADNIYDLIPVKQIIGDKYAVPGVGYFTIDRVACGWLKNGTMVMPTLHKYPNGIAFEKIVEQTDIIVEPESFDNLTNAVRIEEKNKKAAGMMGFLTQNMTGIAMGLLILGIVGMLLMNSINTSAGWDKYNACTNELVALKTGDTPIQPTGEKEPDKPLIHGADTITRMVSQ